MNDFERELMRRSPLAACVLETCDFIFDDAFLRSVWDEHRGRCYEDVLKFDDFLRLMRDALVNHGGSAHRVFVDLERDGAQPCDESNFYRKLARTPVPLSRALLRDGTRRLRQLLPEAAEPAASLPACFDAFAVVAGDGKKIKDAAKRLAPTRGYAGKLLGAKALVALDLRSGMALAMSDSLDGMTNDVPLVPELMAQLHQVVAGPMLSVWDRQFDDVATMRRFCQRDGDAFVVRAKQQDAVFTVESAVEGTDGRGRRVLDEIGLLGQGKKRMRVRRVTLFRGRGGGGGGGGGGKANVEEDEDDVVLLTNLLDRRAYSAADLLALYKHRWGIEQVFQQVTETFSLSHLIGCSPKAVLLQFAYCLLLYNLMQLIKTYVARDGKVLAGVVSTFYLFNDVRRELSAWAYHTDGDWPRTHRDAVQMKGRLAELLRGSWDPVAYTKASDKQPRKKPKPKPLLRGGHSSVQRLLEGRVALA
jgi:Transposase DDE domain